MVSTVNSVNMLQLLQMPGFERRWSRFYGYNNCAAY